ncbi:MAG: universal stress protein [Chloroflexi bacterium]|nr:universal stress protein [Chloroflexota bacterium]
MFDRILLVVDGSSHSECTLRYAKELGTKFGSEIFVTHFVKYSPSQFGLDVREQSPEQASQDFDAMGVAAARMTPKQIAHDVDAVGVSAARMTPAQIAHDVDSVGVSAARMTPAQIAHDVDAFGLPKSQATTTQQALDKDFFGVSDEMMQEWAETAQKVVRSYAEILREAGLRAEAKVHEGLADEKIVALARDNDCDAIVIGGRHGGRRGRLFAGVSELVVAKADMPVLVVP